MPVKKNNQEQTLTNDTQIEETPVVRELSQNDKLNKKLLESFLSRINEEGNKFNEINDPGSQEDQNNEFQ